MANSPPPSFNEGVTESPGENMRTVESLTIAPDVRERKPKGLAAQEFQTTIVGMLGHDLRQSLHVIQGTYSLLRSRLKEMPQEAWLDRGERAVTKLTEQLNCMVDAFTWLNAPMRLRSPPSDSGPCSGGFATKTKTPPFKGASISGWSQRMPM